MNKKIRRIIELIALVLISLLVSCKSKEKAPLNDDFLKVPEYKTESSDYVTKSSGENKNQLSITISSDSVSYWFVLAETGGGEMLHNDFIMQNHSWFSYVEACENFKAKERSDKKYFILQFTKIDKETYLHNKD